VTVLSYGAREISVRSLRGADVIELRSNTPVAGLELAVPDLDPVSVDTDGAPLDLWLGDAAGSPEGHAPGPERGPDGGDRRGRGQSGPLTVIQCPSGRRNTASRRCQGSSLGSCSTRRPASQARR
jgi:hypothetical protein